MHLLLEKIWWVSTTHHVELKETSVWNAIVDTSNPHNLTIPFDDMRFDAVEETVAAAPAALKTPMLVTSARRHGTPSGLISKNDRWGSSVRSPFYFSPGRVGWHIHHLPPSAGKVFSMKGFYYILQKFEPMNFTVGQPINSNWPFFRKHRLPGARSQEKQIHPKDIERQV